MNVMGLYVGLAGVRSANTLSLQTAKVRQSIVERDRIDTTHTQHVDL